MEFSTVELNSDGSGSGDGYGYGDGYGDGKEMNNYLVAITKSFVRPGIRWKNGMR